MSASFAQSAPRDRAAFASRSPWAKAAAVLAMGWAALLALFWRDTADLADVYWNSSVYEHCLLIIPVIGWMVWQRFPELKQIAPQGWAGGLVWMAGGMAAWIVGYGADINLGRHFGLIVMVQGMAMTVLGPNVIRALTFPFFYSFFLVPIGDQLVPPLQTLTADMSMVMLEWSGIPATLSGIFITTPTGYFRVAEACAGVNFLIATVALGAMVAHICFARLTRRALFMAACIVVPIIANGIRAWGTMFIAYYQGIEFAAGFDHVFYGWFFFALVLAMILAGAWRFFDRSPHDQFIDARKFQRSYRFGLSLPVALMLAILTSIPAVAIAARSADGAALPPRVYLPEVAGWQVELQPQSRTYWPQFPGASHTVLARYSNADGAVVDLFAAVYDRQEQGRELLAINAGAADPSHDWVWSADTVAYAAADASAKGERVSAPGPLRREVATVYRLRGVTTAETATVKWLSLQNRLLGGDQRVVAVLVSAEIGTNSNARADVQAFLTALGPIGPMADKVSGLSQDAR
jgi:exosortase A